jgi:hypothetical protein
MESWLKARISNAASSGQVSKADGAAIGSALGDIASQLQSSSPPSGTQASGPGQFRKKIDGLINGEVASGKLTDAQATELKDLLQPGKGGPGFVGSAGHDSRHANRASEGNQDDRSRASVDYSADSHKTTDPSQTTNLATSDVLTNFLKVLQEAQTSLAGATYSNTATTTSNAASSLGLVNKIA